MDSIRYENCYAAREVSKQMVPSDWRNVEWTNKMKVYLNSDQAVTAKDLLSMFSPFGCVKRTLQNSLTFNLNFLHDFPLVLQTTVNNNHRYGMVHYHSADEAAVALREMKRSTKEKHIILRRRPAVRPFIRKKTSAAGTVLCSR
ncbi:unnamed protein product [Oreochromis niloticus]|nr:unnamed protein product [Mustela putorius furo]